LATIASDRIADLYFESGLDMTFVISNACIDVKDQSCIEVCPVDCIYVDDEDRMCYVHPDECIDCAVCESACPVGAIFKDDSIPKGSAEFTRINLLWFQDKDQARSEVNAFADTNTSVT
jgi:NAD-dependent dihydropyrimidine dehydrogenase PreA subunit